MIIAVMAREIWTDERLDDLNKKVDHGFARVDADIRELRVEIADMRKENQQEFLKLRKEIQGEGNSLRDAIKSEGAALRGEIRSEGAALRGEIKGEGTSLRGEIAALRAEMNARFDGMNRNFLAGLITIIAAIVGSNAF